MVYNLSVQCTALSQLHGAGAAAWRKASCMALGRLRMHQQDHQRTHLAAACQAQTDRSRPSAPLLAALRILLLLLLLAALWVVAHRNREPPPPHVVLELAPGGSVCNQERVSATGATALGRMGPHGVAWATRRRMSSAQAAPVRYGFALARPQLLAGARAPAQQLPGLPCRSGMRPAHTWAACRGWAREGRCLEPAASRVGCCCHCVTVLCLKDDRESFQKWADRGACGARRESMLFRARSA